MGVLVEERGVYGWIVIHDVAHWWMPPCHPTMWLPVVVPPIKMQ